VSSRLSRAREGERERALHVCSARPRGDATGCSRTEPAGKGKFAQNEIGEGTRVQDTPIDDLEEDKSAETKFADGNDAVQIEASFRSNLKAVRKCHLQSPPSAHLQPIRYESSFSKPPALAPHTAPRLPLPPRSPRMSRHYTPCASIFSRFRNRRICSKRSVATVCCAPGK